MALWFTRNTTACQSSQSTCYLWLYLVTGLSWDSQSVTHGLHVTGLLWDSQPVTRRCTCNRDGTANQLLVDVRVTGISWDSQPVTRGCTCNTNRPIVASLIRVKHYSVSAITDNLLLLDVLVTGLSWPLWFTRNTTVCHSSQTTCYL